MDVRDPDAAGVGCAIAGMSLFPAMGLRNTFGMIPGPRRYVCLLITATRSNMFFRRCRYALDGLRDPRCSRARVGELRLTGCLGKRLLVHTIILRRYSLRVAAVTITARWQHFAYVGVTAVALSWCFPQPGLGWLAHVALVPAAVLAMRCASGWRLFWTAYLVSAVWWVWMLRWLWPVTVPGAVTLSVYVALYWPASLLVLRWLHRGLRVPGVVALPLAWTSLEFVRGYIVMGGFGWFALSHSQAAYEPTDAAGRIIQVADLFGEHAVTFVVAMTSGLIADIWARESENRKLVWTGRWGPSGVVWGVCLGLAWGYGTYRVGEYDVAASPGPVIAVVQTNVSHDNKLRRTPELDAANFAAMVDLTRSALDNAADTDLVVWPETMVPGILNPQSVEISRIGGRTWHEYHETVAKLADRRDVHLLAGASAMQWRDVRDEKGTLFAPDNRYNAVYLYRSDGTQAPQRYNKMHRVPFGEYIPWVDKPWLAWLKSWFFDSLSPYENDYTLTPGQMPVVFEITPETRNPGPAYRVVTPICFEDAVPRVCRRMVYERGRKRADMLVNVTNDGWFGGAGMRAQHFQLAALRSIENRVPTARAVNTGISGFIDSLGRVGPMAEDEGEITRQRIADTLTHRVTLDRRSTLFGRLGHLPVGVLCLATGVMTALGIVRIRREKQAARQIAAESASK